MGASGGEDGARDVRGACRRTALSGSTDESGDMMMDGLPDVRASERRGRSFFSGGPPRTGVAAGVLQELAAGIG